MNGIHSTAIVEVGAELHPSVSVGPFCYVGPHVRIGENTRLHSHVVIEGHTRIGADNNIFPQVVLGADPQDTKYAGEPTETIIGDHNIFREGATVHRGTVTGHGRTQVGNGGFFMAYTHVAHDCHVGDRVIMCNCAALAGHVVVGDGAYLSGLIGIHQFCRVGELALLSGGAMVPKDVPPFCIAQGDRARLVGLNVVGLRRAGVPAAEVKRIKRAYQLAFFSTEPMAARMERILTEVSEQENDAAARFARFILESKRGVCIPRMSDAVGMG